MYRTILISLFSLCILGCNAIPITCFIKRKRLRDNPSYWYLTALACSDCFTAIVLIPLQMLKEDPSMKMMIPCRVHYFFHALHYDLGVYLLTVASVDRFVKLRFTFRYRGIMTQRKVLAIILMVFLWSTMLSVGDVFVLHCKTPQEIIDDYGPWAVYCKVVIMTITLLPYLVMGFFNWKVYSIASVNIRERRRSSASSTGIGKRNSHPSDEDPHKQQPNPDSEEGDIASRSILSSIQDCVRASIQESLLERKVILMMSVIEFTNLITCMLPALVYMVFLFYLWNQVASFTRSSLPWLFYSNSLMDPLILMSMNRDFRIG